MSLLGLLGVDCKCLCVCVCVELYVLGRAQKINNTGEPVRDIYTAFLRFDTFLWYPTWCHDFTARHERVYVRAPPLPLLFQWLAVSTSAGTLRTGLQSDSPDLPGPRHGKIAAWEPT